ncbi:MAG: hypothetical protein ACREXY_18930 [Gammaproteobacteria bacterium]
MTNVDLSGIFGKVVTAPPLEFEWHFGDGNTATTRTPVVSHDYFAAIDHAAGVGQFVVTCQVKHAGITVRRTLTIYSAYAICKGTGTVVPHVTADLFAHKRYTPQAGQLRFDVKGLSVLYAGTVGAFPVRCSAVFDVPVTEWSKRPQFDLRDLPPRYRKPWPWARKRKGVTKAYASYPQCMPRLTR